ncbi:MAG: SDR family oxidoreductase [Myxococcales bacterium]
MAYLVTGASGFIGKHLIDLLLQREGSKVYALVRASSRDAFLDVAKKRWGQQAHRVIPVLGDITLPKCGLDDSKLAELPEAVSAVFHLAALYDLGVSHEIAHKSNVQGTRHAVSLANQLGVRFHYVSSIAVAGQHKGHFREDMFDAGQKLDHPYFATKYEAEAVVRRECKVPFRIYRPGMVVGSSVTGEAEKIDGVYYAFKPIQQLRNALPQWLPLLGIEGGNLPLAPVDYVAAAIDFLAHADGLDGRAFHLVDSKPPHVGEALNEFCKAAHAPRFTARLDSRLMKILPRGVLQVLGSVPVVKAIKRDILNGFGIPESALEFIDWRTTFDTRDAEAVLRPAGIVCPPLSSYAWKIWDYWERHMDPDLFRDRTLTAALRNKNVLITGASSGIGRSVALKVAEAGGLAILVARSEENLAQVRSEIEASGGHAATYSCDLSSLEACDALVASVLRDHGRVDVLVNNAGRSIRRSIAHSYDRFHDYERTIRLNYFGSLKLILGFLPGMRERRSGHIINVSSIGVLTNAPRFSAYVASKAALDALTRCIASEMMGEGVELTNVYMPLVRTPMISPTKIYELLPALSPEEAAEMVLGPMVTHDKRVTTRLGAFTEAAYALAPRLVDRVMGLGYRVFPEHTRTEGKEAAQVSPEGMAFAYLLQGIHW